jgi:hypothetical protein
MRLYLNVDCLAGCNDVELHVKERDDLISSTRSGLVGEGEHLLRSVSTTSLPSPPS